MALCRYCEEAEIPPRPPGKRGPPQRICAACQPTARAGWYARYYRRNRSLVTARNREWNRSHPERMKAARERYARGHRPPSRDPVRMSLYRAAYSEATRLGVDPGLHWFRWLSGTLPA